MGKNSKTEQKTPRKKINRFNDNNFMEYLSGIMLRIVDPLLPFFFLKYNLHLLLVTSLIKSYEFFKYHIHGIAIKNSHISSLSLVLHSKLLIKHNGLLYSHYSTHLLALNGKGKQKKKNIRRRKNFYPCVNITLVQ